MVGVGSRFCVATSSGAVQRLFCLDGAWSVNPELRAVTESAGGKTYSLAGRSLTALRSPRLGHVLLYIDAGRSVKRSLEAAGVPRADWSHYVRMLQHLYEMGGLAEFTPSPPAGAEASYPLKES